MSGEDGVEGPVVEVRYDLGYISVSWTAVESFSTFLESTKLHVGNV